MDRRLRTPILHLFLGAAELLLIFFYMGSSPDLKRASLAHMPP